MYLAAKELFVEAVLRADPHTDVPACPRWRVRDLLAHQVHQLNAACDGTFPAKDAVDAMISPDHAQRVAARRRQDEWIARGIAERASESVTALVEDWGAATQKASQSAQSILEADIAVHLFDLLGGVGSQLHRDHPLVLAALRHWHAWSTIRLESVGRGALRIETKVSGTPTSIGPTQASVVVTGEAFELLRTITGRRSWSQADSFRWRPADQLIREQFPVYGWRDADLVE